MISYIQEPQTLPEKKIKKRALPTPAKSVKSAAKAEAPLIRSSAELLADPQKGKVFSSYFSKLKEKIQQTIRKRYSRASVGEGSVSLVFVLRADGSLENILVRQGESSAAALAKAFAVECVRGSAPFKPFPKELDLLKISFSLTMSFDQS